MNRKDLAGEVSEFILANVGEDDTSDIDLGEAASQVEDFIQELDADAADDEEEGEAEEGETAEEPSGEAK
jgi:hypothetical protein